MTTADEFGFESNAQVSAYALTIVGGAWLLSISRNTPEQNYYRVQSYIRLLLIPNKVAMEILYTSTMESRLYAGFSRSSRSSTSGPRNPSSR